MKYLEIFDFLMLQFIVLKKQENGEIINLRIKDNDDDWNIKRKKIKLKIRKIKKKSSGIYSL